MVCLYALKGNPAYPLHPQLQGPLKNKNLSSQQADFHKSYHENIIWMGVCEILSYFFFPSYKKDLKIELSTVCRMNVECIVLCIVLCFVNKRTHLFTPIHDLWFLLILNGKIAKVFHIGTLYQKNWVVRRFPISRENIHFDNFSTWL